MKNTDLIIFGGQSNMQGQTDSFPATNDPVEGAFEYRLISDSLVPLKHPVGENLDLDGNEFALDYTIQPQALWRDPTATLAGYDINNDYISASMLPDFCRAYIEVTGRNVVAVHAAKGATTIEYWQKGGGAYNILVKKAKAAIEKVQPEHIYFVWLQGESNALEKMPKEEYKRQLDMLNASLRDDLGIEKFGMIQVGQFAILVSEDRVKFDLEIINAQKEICLENDDFLMLTTVTEQLTKIPSYMNPVARGHYNYEGQKIIGTFAGNALGRYKNSEQV
ncbi:MAG: hypothetical protein IJY93_04870 [Clostridia bacterium]|nr:hypothetical protein [Clostridia bacterium]